MEADSFARGIELSHHFGDPSGKPVYLLTRVYSAEEQTLHMQVFGAKKFRVWHNGSALVDSLDYEGYRCGREAEVTLKKGWNTFTVQESNWVWGDLVQFALYPKP